MSQSKTFLVLNSGSSSKKFSLYEAEKEVCSLHFEYAKGTSDKVICSVKKAGKDEDLDKTWKSLDEAFGEAEKIFQNEGFMKSENSLTAILIRLVAPGKYFTRPRLVDENTEKELDKITPYSPIHAPLAKSDIVLVHKYFKDVPILLVSDSEFLAKPSRRDYVYALPEELTKEDDIARYGAHGLSYGYIVNKLKSVDKLAPKTIICHLGSGCSVTAFENGEPVYTSMGETPLEGLMSSSRPGAIGPVMIARLAEKYGTEKVVNLVSNESGFKALSGTNDMREVMSRAEAGDQGSITALNYFIDGILDKIGSYAARMGGLDELVFSGTVGMRSAYTQTEIVKKLTFLGFSLKPETAPIPSDDFKTYSDASEITKNIKKLTKESGYVEISAEGSKPVLVVPTDEAAYMIQVASDFFSSEGSPLSE